MAAKRCGWRLAAETRPLGGLLHKPQMQLTETLIHMYNRHRNRYAGLIICLLAILLVASIPTTVSSLSISPTYCQNVINGMVALTSGLQLPKYFLQENARKTGSEFDVNRYFSVLNHLSLPSGYTLDYFYFFGGIGGEPILYARSSGQAPYQTRADYEAANGKISLDEVQYKFIDSVQVDDTTEGFFQFIVLRTMGNQFYQYWHAGYNDYRLICSDAGLDALLSEANEYGPPLPLLVQIQARLLNLTPSVEINIDTVRVQVMVFTKWGGFLRQTFTFNRHYPHTPIKVDAETVIAYDWGVAY